MNNVKDVDEKIVDARKKKLERKEKREKEQKKQELPKKAISGVFPLSVAIPPYPCPFNCAYCPTFPGIPKSYVPDSPAVKRYKDNKWKIKETIRSRIERMERLGTPTDKVELILIGGTFLALPKAIKEAFIKEIYEALNEKASSTLDEAVKANEKAKHRAVALCIETRPDVINVEEMLRYGTTRVEIGVQAIDDAILKLVNRGHGVAKVKEATALLKDAGFKVGYHMMPALPGSTPEKDLAMYRELWTNEAFKPDQMKLYPTLVIKNAELEKWYKEGRYKPYPEDVIKKLLHDMLLMTPRYVRVVRVMRDIPKRWIVAGTIHTHLRMEAESNKAKEIRSREIGYRMKRGYTPKPWHLKTYEYTASKGKEFFIEAVDENDVLYGLIRLRFPHKIVIDELENHAIIRELHVYGPAARIGSKSETQHRGIGKALLARAEEIAKEAYDDIAVISGVGVREYYRKRGYTLGKYYMHKRLKG